MRTAVSVLLLLFALAAAGAGFAVQMGRLAAPVPAQGLFIAAGVFLLLFVVRLLPLAIRRPIVFLLTLIVLSGLAGGVYYMQFVFKPQFLKGVLAQAFAPKPTAVTAEAARIEKWAPELSAIGTVRAYQGIAIAPQVAGVVTGLHFQSGETVKEGSALVSIDDSVEQADLASGLATLKNADLTLARQSKLASGETRRNPPSTAPSPRAIRRKPPSTAPRRLSRRKRSARRFPAVSACAWLTSASSSPSDNRYRRFSGWIRST